MERFGIFLAEQRNAAIMWARRVKGRGDWVILDTETTGLKEDAEVIQIAVLNNQGRPVMDTLIKPTKPIPADAFAVHGIGDDQVADAPTYDQIHHKLVSLLHHRQCLIYNAEYDRRILRQTAQLYDLTPPVYYQWDQCVMQQYARFVGDWNHQRESFRWQKLPPIEGVDAHNALADCKATLALIEKMAKAELAPLPNLVEVG